MTRKDYIQFAKLIETLDPGPNLTPEEQKKLFAVCLCTLFKRDNPRFKEDVFLKACGLSF